MLNIIINFLKKIEVNTQELLKNMLIAFSARCRRLNIKDKILINYKKF